MYKNQNQRADAHPEKETKAKHYSKEKYEFKKLLTEAGISDKTARSILELYQK